MITEKRSFYKYATAETALLILRNRTLRYSSPVLFNDPFDVQTKLDYGFTLSEFDEAFRKEIYRLVHSEEEPACFNNGSCFGDIIKLRQMNGISPIIPIELLKKEIEPFLREHSKFVENEKMILNSWWQRFVRASRIFCVSEEPDILLMWAHYTKDHTGVVLKFECLPELDNALCAAKKVEYVQKPPVLGELDEFIKSLTGQSRKLDHTRGLDDDFLSKSEHWRYEKEWRVFIPPYDENPINPTDENGSEILFIHIPLYPQELSAIYFGCRMEQKEREQVEGFLVGDFAHVKRYNAIRNENQYRLDFAESGTSIGK